jgi:hypothetical protein
MTTLTIKISDKKNVDFFIQLLSKFNFVVELNNCKNEADGDIILKNEKSIKTNKKSKKDNISNVPFKFGATKNLIKISDDFNEPLNEFNEYL